MTIDFYCGSGSPFAWRVWLALEHKQVPYELKLLSFSAGDTRKPEFLALNPRHTVPLIVDDGFVLYESAAILEYLDERFHETPSLFSGPIQERATARRLIREADEYFSDALDALTEKVFHVSKEEWSAPAIAEASKHLVDELHIFERYATEHGFLVNTTPGAADFTLYPYLALALRAQSRCPHVSVRAAIPPKLANWQHRMESLPYFAKTLPPHWKAA